MTGHNQYLSDKYSEILEEKLREQKSLEGLSHQEMKLIHSTLSNAFGSFDDKERIKRAMKKIIESIEKDEDDE